MHTSLTHRLRFRVPCPGAGRCSPARCRRPAPHRLGTARAPAPGEHAGRLQQAWWHAALHAARLAPRARRRLEAAWRGAFSLSENRALNWSPRAPPCSFVPTSRSVRGTPAAAHSRQAETERTRRRHETRSDVGNDARQSISLVSTYRVVGRAGRGKSSQHDNTISLLKPALRTLKLNTRASQSPPPRSHAAAFRTAQPAGAGAWLG